MPQLILASVPIEHGHTIISLTDEEPLLRAEEISSEGQ
jgi:hypothetical protein